MTDFHGARREVLELLRKHPGVWFRVQELAKLLGNRYAETGISSYCRALRREEYGAHDIRCEKVPGTDRTYAYAYFLPPPQPEQKGLGFAPQAESNYGTS